jgi:hypothetical protein
MKNILLKSKEEIKIEQLTYKGTSFFSSTYK